jgi:hypothetical protein
VSVLFLRIGQFAPRMAPRRRYNSPVRRPTPTHDQGAVCTAAGVNPDHYRVCAHEGPEATAPATAGSTVAVTSWAVYRPTCERIAVDMSGRSVVRHRRLRGGLRPCRFGGTAHHLIK